MLKEREEYYIGLIMESESLIEVCRKAGIVPTTGNYDTLKKVIKENNLNISHFKRNSGNNSKKRDINVYLNNEFPIQAYNLKNRLLKEGYKEYKCEKCGNTEWYGKPIPLELHHINGDNTDNRLENLQLLCSNCHAFTDTYGGKNQKLNPIKRYCKTCGKELHGGQDVYCSTKCRFGNYKEEIIEASKKYNSISEIAKITKHAKGTVRKILKNENRDKNKDEKLLLIIESIKRTKSYSGTAREFGVSDNAIKKMLVRRGYPGHIKELLESINQKEKI